MTDQDADKTTEIQPEPEPAPEPQQPRPRRLLRSRDDRVIAGVSGGLGRYFDIDPVIVRIAFAVSILFGGLGVIAYIAAALFVPSDDGTGAPAPSSRGQGVGRVIGLGLLAIAGLFGFGALAAAAAFVTGLGYGLIVAGAIVAIGILLAALSFRGGAKWLIVPALALSIGVGVAAAADLDLEGGVGKRTYVPSSASAIPADGYELGVGRLAIDLRQIDWSPQRRLELDARVGAGEMLIAVPSDVCVVADAHAGAGELRVAGQQRRRVRRRPGHRRRRPGDAAAAARRRRRHGRDPRHQRRRRRHRRSGPWDRWDHIDDGEESLAREANQEACAR